MVLAASGASINGALACTANTATSAACTAVSRVDHGGDCTPNDFPMRAAPESLRDLPVMRHAGW